MARSFGVPAVMIGTVMAVALHLRSCRGFGVPLNDTVRVQRLAAVNAAGGQHAPGRAAVLAARSRLLPARARGHASRWKHVCICCTLLTFCVLVGHYADEILSRARGGG